MRWHDWIIALTLTALTVTAALQFRAGVPPALSQTGVDRSFQDTTYVIAHVNYVASHCSSRSSPRLWTTP